MLLICSHCSNQFATPDQLADQNSTCPCGGKSCGPLQEQDRLWELLSLRQQKATAGEPVPAEELCRDCPELLPELQQRLDALGEVNQLVRPVNEVMNSFVASSWKS